MCLVGLVINANAQNSIPNGTFENWIQGVYSLPVGYPVSSNPQSFFRWKTAFNVTHSTDAYHGISALKLTTIVSQIGDTAFAYCLNIQPTDNAPSAWHGGMPYTQRPLGIKGYYKYNLASQDSGAILVAFSRGGKNICTYIYLLGGLHSVYTPFNFTFSPPLNKKGLANDNVRAIQFDPQGNFWIGTDAGVMKFNSSGWVTFDKTQGLVCDTVNSIYIEGNGTKWFGTSNGVSRFTATGWKNYTTADGLANNQIRGIQVDGLGNKWFGTNGGGVSELSGNTWVSYTTATGLVSDSVRNIRLDNQGNLWVATNAGLSVFNGNIWKTMTAVDGLANNDVRQIQIDAKGTKWFATFGGGVSKYNDTTWVTYTTADGLAGNKVYRIAIDLQGNKWFATDAGVTKFDGTNWTTYTRSNGLACDSVRPIAIDANGNKWFGTPGFGMSKFDGASWKTFTNLNTTVPDSMVFASISCKFGLNTQQPVALGEGSLLLDSISLTGVTSQPVLFNGDFENWANTTLEIPGSWNYVGGDQGDGLRKSTVAYQGTYAAELVTYAGNNNGVPAARPAQLTTGYYNDKCQCITGGFPYSQVTDTLVFNYKYTPVGNDSARVVLFLYKNRVNTGGVDYALHAASNYTYVEIPFVASQAPDTAVILLSSGYGMSESMSLLGSDLLIDNIHFKSQPLNTLNPIQQVSSRASIYPNPSSGMVWITTNHLILSDVQVVSLDGRIIFEQQVKDQSDVYSLNLEGLPKGAYLLKIQGSGWKQVEHLVLK